MCIRDRNYLTVASQLNRGSSAPVDPAVFHDASALVAGVQAAKARLDDLAPAQQRICLLYTSDAADERSSVDLGGRRIIKNKNKKKKKSKAAVLL